MATVVRVLIFLLVLGCIAGRAARAQSGPEAPPVARIDGHTVHCEIEPTALERCALAFMRLVRARAERAYIDDHALHATDDEIEAVYAYEQAFRAHDRSQRARKLLQLDERLASPTLPDDERLRLEAFRTVLVRLARYDADVDAGTEQADDLPRESAAAWVQQAKLDAQLHRRFGGVVGVRASGLYAHGARADMLREFVVRHPIEWLAIPFQDAFERLLGASPVITYRGQDIDFTPFWLRPIPASYMHD